MLDRVHFPFPLALSPGGVIEATGGSDAVRGRILQVLFTAPGERVHLPDFGCGLFNLVFEPDDAVLSAALEFTVWQALNRWLRDEIVVEGVGISSDTEGVTVEIAYVRRSDLAKQAVRIRFR